LTPLTHENNRLKKSLSKTENISVVEMWCGARAFGDSTTENTEGQPNVQS